MIPCDHHDAAQQRAVADSTLISSSTSGDGHRLGNSDGSTWCFHGPRRESPGESPGAVGATRAVGLGSSWRYAPYAHHDSAPTFPGELHGLVDNLNRQGQRREAAPRAARRIK